MLTTLMAAAPSPLFHNLSNLCPDSWARGLLALRLVGRLRDEAVNDPWAAAVQERRYDTTGVDLLVPHPLCAGLHLPPTEEERMLASIERLAAP